MSLQQECPPDVTVDPITTPAICGYQEEVCPNDYTSCCPIRSRRTRGGGARRKKKNNKRSEEHTSELQSRETISYAVFCLKKKKNKTKKTQKKKKKKEKKKKKTSNYEPK